MATILTKCDHRSGSSKEKQHDDHHVKVIHSGLLKFCRKVESGDGIEEDITADDPSHLSHPC